jgi:hypothetical protein
VSSEQDLDFSVGNIPDTWHQAALDAPKAGPNRSPTSSGGLKLLPSGRSADLGTACLAGLATSIIYGYAWYQLATNEALTSPWVAAGLGVAVALAVRLGGGSEDPQARGVVSLLLYLGTWSVVMFGISHFLFADLYDTTPTLVEYEQQLLHSRLTNPPAIVAWLVGAVASVQVGYLLRA